MDLEYVIAELRAELESVNQITAALEKLIDLRQRREDKLGDKTDPFVPQRRKRSTAAASDSEAGEAA
jgi:hypothetical protein